jgi:7-cyano-7-deazaguanine synthase
VPRDLAIALLSGGMDSCVCAAIAAREHRLALLHVGYGQRTAARERRAFEEIADFYGVRRRLVCSLDYMRDIGGSSLTDERIPVSKKGLDAAGDAVPTSYVPFRNTHLIAIAVSWGEALGARSVYIGAVEADSSG